MTVVSRAGQERRAGGHQAVGPIWPSWHNLCLSPACWPPGASVGNSPCHPGNSCSVPMTQQFWFRSLQPSSAVAQGPEVLPSACLSARAAEPSWVVPLLQKTPDKGRKASCTAALPLHSLCYPQQGEPLLLPHPPSFSRDRKSSEGGLAFRMLQQPELASVVS